MGKMMLIAVMLVTGGCMGAPLPIDVAPDGGSAPLIQCRLILQEPFAADVASPDAHCDVSTDGTEALFTWAANRVVVKAGSEMVTWQDMPSCKTPTVNASAGEIVFDGRDCGNVDEVRGELRF